MALRVAAGVPLRRPLEATPADPQPGSPGREQWQTILLAVIPLSPEDNLNRRGRLGMDYIVGPRAASELTGGTPRSDVRKGGARWSGQVWPSWVHSITF
jgi:hypothetical protein